MLTRRRGQTSYGRFIWLRFPVRIDLFNLGILIFLLLIMAGILEPQAKEPDYVVDKVEDGSGDDEKLGTVRDKKDMHRLGKLQELRVGRSTF